MELNKISKLVVDHLKPEMVVSNDWYLWVITGFLLRLSTSCFREICVFLSDLICGVEWWN